MNIGIAREQDSLAQQKSPLSPIQKVLIQERPQKSFEILQQIGITDEDQLDLVRWHHGLDAGAGLARNVQTRTLLRMVNQFVAKMAPRKTRLAMSALGAARSVFVGVDADTAKLGSAMATALGFYPPGSYVLLVNGEEAVAVARGARANEPKVLSIVSPGGMPLSKYLYRDTNDPQFAVRSPINPEKIKMKINLEKVRKARLDHAA